MHSVRVSCLFICERVFDGSTSDWVCYGGLGDTRQLPARPGAADDESTCESCSSASLLLFSEEISGDLRDPVGCVCVFRERVKGSGDILAL